ncbi:hypothetical protein V4U86_20070 [Mycobacterium sp. AMU20-3851]|uniref:hypothetical protein n=1 Tax=Mycobacterium sp. AMU20-3851 TaxID=3122055 RepID=UPI00375523EA
MEALIPETVRQARWYIAGGILAIIVGVVRASGFATHGGIVYLVMAVLFLTLGVASVAAGVIRIRRGDGGPER